MTITVDEFIARLPKSSEVPKVTQDQLRRLYVDDVRGIHDNDLMSEIESRLAARLGLMIDFTDLFHHSLLAAKPPEPDVIERDVEGNVVAVRMTDGTPARILSKEDMKKNEQEFVRILAGRTLGEAGEIRIGDVVDRARDAVNKYDIDITDWGRTALISALRKLNAARRTRDTRKRMMAIDRVIHLAHAQGPLAGSLIEDSPLDAEEFLDRLDQGSFSFPSGRRRPHISYQGVLVRRHARRLP